MPQAPVRYPLVKLAVVALDITGPGACRAIVGNHVPPAKATKGNTCLHFSCFFSLGYYGKLF